MLIRGYGPLPPYGIERQQETRLPNGCPVLSHDFAKKESR